MRFSARWGQRTIWKTEQKGFSSECPDLDSRVSGHHQIFGHGAVGGRDLRSTELSVETQRQSEGRFRDGAWEGAAGIIVSEATSPQSLHLNNLHSACSPKNFIGSKHSSQVLVGLSELEKMIFIMCSTKCDFKERAHKNLIRQKC